MKLLLIFINIVGSFCKFICDFMLKFSFTLQFELLQVRQSLFSNLKWNRCSLDLSYTHNDVNSPLSPGGMFMVQKMAITSPIPVFYGLIGHISILLVKDL